nr:immunoglobulin heavy chain junction region [Macaca mulatta]
CATGRWGDLDHW